MTVSTRARRERNGDARRQATLRSIHDQWLSEVHAALDPASTPGSSLWDRWSAARYLADEFELPFRRERRLVTRLRHKLPRADAEWLEVRAARLDEIRRQLNLVGRRRDTAGPMAELTRSFLGLLESWCRHIEAAATDAGAERQLDAPIDAIGRIGRIGQRAG
jgi:hypothetical protein